MPLRDEVVRRLVVYPLPKNTDPERDLGRRAARALALARQYKEAANAIFVDAAKCRGKRDAFTTVAIRASTGELLTASTVRTRAASRAEEAAISAALRIPGTTTILSDSKTAIRNFARGVVWKTAAKIAETGTAPIRSTVALKWFPAHAGRELATNIGNRNEEADAAARELAKCRAVAEAPSDPSEQDHNEEEDAEPITDYGEVLRWYRDQRQAFPPPHRELSRAEAVRFRQLQTETVLTPALARHMCPDLFEDATCSVCKRETATLSHLMWGCESEVRDGGDNVQCSRDTYPPDVRECVCSTDINHQRRVIQRLEAALAKQRRKSDPNTTDPRQGRKWTGSSSSPSKAGTKPRGLHPDL